MFDRHRRSFSLSRLARCVCVCVSVCMYFAGSIIGLSMVIRSGRIAL